MKKGKKYFFTLLFILLMGALFAYNLIIQKSSFFNMSLFEITSLSVAVLVAYYFSQKKNDERKLKEEAANIIAKIQKIINSDEASKINCECDVVILVRLQRNISNKIDILQKMAKRLGCQDDMDYISGKFKEYREFTGEKMADINYLHESENQLKNMLSCIDDKCDYIKLLLYC